MSNLNEIKEALKLLNLNPNAIKFYLASYKKGLTSIGKIAQSVNLDRSSAYLSFEQLKRKGLVNEEKNKKVITFCVKSPKTILSKLRLESRKLRNQCSRIEDRMPELLAAYSKSDSQPIMQFFSGSDGLKSITDDILAKEKTELLMFSNQKHEKRVFNKIDHKEFIKERIEKRIKVRVLTPDTAEAHELQKNDRLALRETKIIKSKDIPFDNEIYIYADKIAMLEFVNDIQGFIVKSEAFYKSMKWMFEELWKTY